MDQHKLVVGQIVNITPIKKGQIFHELIASIHNIRASMDIYMDIFCNKNRALQFHNHFYTQEWLM